MDTKKLKTLTQLLMVVCIVALAACMKKPEYELRRFQITTIDSFEIRVNGEVADFARVSDSISIHVFGTVGPI